MVLFWFLDFYCCIMVLFYEIKINVKYGRRYVFLFCFFWILDFRKEMVVFVGYDNL